MSAISARSHRGCCPGRGSVGRTPIMTLRRSQHPPLSLRSGVRRRRCGGPALVGLAVPDTATEPAGLAMTWVWETGLSSPLAQKAEPRGGADPRRRFWPVDARLSPSLRSVCLRGRRPRRSPNATGPGAVFIGGGLAQRLVTPVHYEYRCGAYGSGVSARRRLLHHSRR